MTRHDVINPIFPKNQIMTINERISFAEQFPGEVFSEFPIPEKFQFHLIPNQDCEFKLVERALEDGGSKFMSFMITGRGRQASCSIIFR